MDNLALGSGIQGFVQGAMDFIKLNMQAQELANKQKSEENLFNLRQKEVLNNKEYHKDLIDIRKDEFDQMLTAYKKQQEEKENRQNARANTLGEDYKYLTDEEIKFAYNMKKNQETIDMLKKSGMSQEYAYLAVNNPELFKNLMSGGDDDKKLKRLENWMTRSENFMNSLIKRIKQDPKSAFIFGTNGDINVNEDNYSDIYEKIKGVNPKLGQAFLNAYNNYKSAYGLYNSYMHQYYGDLGVFDSDNKNKGGKRPGIWEFDQTEPNNGGK